MINFVILQVDYFQNNSKIKNSNLKIALKILLKRPGQFF